MSKRVCVVCEYAWIICGLIKDESSDVLTLERSAVVRKWSNGRGIGGISNKEYKDEYTLDPIGNVDIMKSKILFTIPCEW